MPPAALRGASSSFPNTNKQRCGIFSYPSAEIPLTCFVFLSEKPSKSNRTTRFLERVGNIFRTCKPHRGIRILGFFPCEFRPKTTLIRPITTKNAITGLDKPAKNRLDFHLARGRDVPVGEPSEAPRVAVDRFPRRGADLPRFHLRGVFNPVDCFCFYSFHSFQSRPDRKHPCHGPRNSCFCPRTHR